MTGRKIFLLSPAFLGGKRAALLTSPKTESSLGQRLQSGDAVQLGALYSFVSGLYFRGKLSYAQTFGHPPANVPPSLVIVPGEGLRPPDWPVTHHQLEKMAAVPVDLKDARYREALERGARALAGSTDCPLVLLGSIASGKYGTPLSQIFEGRLFFPQAFVGRGDMSRGGLLLRAVAAGQELDYVPFAESVRHGPRPARLDPTTRPRPTTRENVYAR